MDRRSRGILVGMVLGDGCLRKTSKNSSSLQIKHGCSQRDYIEHKANLLHSILGGKKPAVTPINNNGYAGFVITKGCRYMDILRNWIYSNNVKKFNRKVLNLLNEEGIALWYMDDGSLVPKRRNGKIHAYEMYLCTYLTKEENQVIIDYFKEVWGVRFTQTKNKGKYRLRCGTKEFRKFREIVKPYIIPSMQYKITTERD